jgi:nucleoside-diphosphate-sugar epimerase
MARAGHEVLGVDALGRSAAPAAARANRAALTDQPGLTLIETDLAVDDLAKLGEADVIVHLAGRPGVRTSFGAGAADVERDNVTATRRLLAACAERPSGRRPRVVIASSSSVYGSAGDRPHREDDLLRPASPYAVSKAAVERLTAQAARGGVPTVVLRYFSVYGPRQRPDMAFHRFIGAALAGRALPVLGDGRQSRAFTHVSDVVAATLAAATAELTPGTVINVGHPEPVQVRSAIALLADLLGVRPRVRNYERAPGDASRTWADTERAARLLRWRARVGPAEGLADQIAWQRRRGTTPAGVGEAAGWGAR